MLGMTHLDYKLNRDHVTLRANGKHSKKWSDGKDKV